MAAPADITLKNLDGQWVMNRDLSSNYDGILKLQGINWLMRKVLNMTTVVLSIKEWVDPSTSVTHMDIELKPSSGLPGSTEVRVFNFQGIEVTHPVFGKIRGRTRWTGAKELDEVDAFLAQGFEEGMDTYMHMMTEHLDHGAVTHQACGFEQIEGTRYHTRHLYVRNGEEALRVKLVYDYLGPRVDQN